jgi:hypothetical protein
VRDVRSGERRSLKTDWTFDESPVWSPDGRWVYFSSLVEGTWQVSRMPADGGPPAPLTRDGGRLLAISPDGLRLYYARSARLWTIPAGGGDPVEILDRVPDHLVVTERGFFCAFNAATNSIHYVDFGLRSSTVVAELADWIMGLSVSPDRSRLVFGLIDHKRADLMLVDGFE